MTEFYLNFFFKTSKGLDYFLCCLDDKKFMKTSTCGIDFWGISQTESTLQNDIIVYIIFFWFQEIFSNWHL